MKYKKKILCFFLCIALMTGLFPVSAAFAAADWPTDVSISADGGILMDAGSGAILYEKNSREAYYPASITKILTALVILENCDLDETVTFSNEAVNTLEPSFRSGNASTPFFSSQPTRWQTLWRSTAPAASMPLRS